MPAKLSPDAIKEAQETGTVHFSPLLYLTVPPTLVPGIIEALTLQKEAYEKIFGTINVPHTVRGGRKK